MPNQVVIENWQLGTSDWKISNPSLAGEIEGFASTTTVLPRETIDFFVSTQASTFSMQIFRMGWYGGAGGHLMKEEPMLPGIDQSAATAHDPNFGTVHCTNWQKSYSLQIPETWVSGIYLVKLATIPGVGTPVERYIIFVVKAPYPSDLLWVSPVNTYHAYNGFSHGANWQLGLSLYQEFDYGPNAGQHVNAVSFNRPYSDGLGAGNFLTWEYPMLFWLEGNGYDVTYATSEDLHTGRVTYPGAAFLSVGHDEYWSFEMRAAIEGAIASGVSVGFFGANPMYWQVRFENDTKPMATNRNMLCYKCYLHCFCSDASGKWGPCFDASGILQCKDVDATQKGIDPWNAPEATAYQRRRLTARWRDLLLGRPEQNVVGQMYVDWVRSAGQTFPWVVFNDAHWAFTGTGLNNGDQVDGIIGDEFDGVYGLDSHGEYGNTTNDWGFTSSLADGSNPDVIQLSTPPTLDILAQSQFTNDDPTGQNPNAGVQQSNSTIYQAASGAWVFSAGSIVWGRALADVEGLGPEGFSDHVTHNVADERLQLFTANILNTFITGLEPLESGGPRIGVLAREGTLFVKEGALDARWWVQGSRIVKFAMDGNRIGVLTQDGNLFVKDGTLFGTVFVLERSNVHSFALAGQRIGVLDNNGNLFVKEGPLDAWTQESSSVRSFALEGQRIGILDNSGNVFVKEGPLDASWTWESSPIQSFSLAGQRIGVLDKSGNLFVKEGPLDAPWTWESSPVQTFALAGNRIGVLLNDGTVYVKEGPLDASWTWESSPIQSFSLVP